jgi:CarD family transcriptional regulator
LKVDFSLEISREKWYNSNREVLIIAKAPTDGAFSARLCCTRDFRRKLPIVIRYFGKDQDSKIRRRFCDGIIPNHLFFVPPHSNGRTGGEMMYQPGEIIFYGNSGVCRVEEIAPLSHIEDCDPDRLYYKLVSVHGGEVIYVPVDTSIFMRPVIGRIQAEALLEHASSIPEEAFHTRDLNELRQHYRQIMESHNSEQLLGMIRSINAKERQAARSKKQLGRIDQEYKKRADTLLCEELAVALELPLKEAHSLLNRSMQSHSSDRQITA